MKFVKPFTISAAAAAAAFVTTKVFKAVDQKKKRKMVGEELERLHKIERAEINKNGKASNETMKKLDKLTKTLL